MDAKGGADAGFLAEYIDPEAPAFRRYVGEVDVVAFAQLLQLVLGQHLGNVAFELGLTQIAEFDGHEIAVHAQHRRHADRQMQVRAALRHAQLQERVDSCHNA